jgi:hypothetical protein
VCGDRWLHQRERIEDSHRLLVPPLRTKGLPEHFQCAGVMLVCTERPQAFFLRGCNLAAGQILSRKIEQRGGIGRGRHL